MAKIIVDPKIRFGKPTIEGTRITAEEVIGALAGGMDFNEIEKEYGLTKEQILSAVRYVAGWIKGEETKDYAFSPRR
jgi:uncharacterized protein (DUF433 family)